MQRGTAVDLYWLPLGAGGRSVRLNGRVFEALSAGVQRRPRLDLYHAGLEVRMPEGSYVIEMAPVWSGPATDRGTVAEGPVGLRVLGRWRWFRYEVRRWRDGVIPDRAEAVDSPRLVTGDREVANRLLQLVPSVPRLVWGRDELGLGDMWNSNSLVSWLLCRAGVDTEPVMPPAGGRAPGWAAGLALAARQGGAEGSSP
jgi:hypothetical protein